MKSVVIASVLGLMMLGYDATIAVAQVADAIRHFDEGNRLYREGDYSGAIDVYNQAIDAGFVSGPLYHNLGNAYFRVDALGQAIRYYEKALLIMPTNETLLHNLDIARQNRVDQISELPTPLWVTWWNGMAVRTGGRGLFWIGILVYFGAIYLVIQRIRTGSRNPWLRRALVGSMAVASVMLLAALMASLQGADQQRAVVVVDAVPLYDNVDTSVTSSLDIHEGLVVRVLGELGNLTEVQLPNGNTGWVDTEALADV